MPNAVVNESWTPAYRLGFFNLFFPFAVSKGWMTPRAGVKTTLASETRLKGFPVPSGNPTFFDVANVLLSV
jgi:hypothetical protein